MTEGKAAGIDRILIIDDCRITVLLLKHVLGKAGVHVDSAGSGEEGIILAAGYDYPLIFLDIMLPGQDGFEVCRRLRSRSPGRTPRIILLTAMGERFSREKMLEAGADIIFFKPIVPSQILEVTREAMEERAAEGAAGLVEEGTGAPPARGERGPR